MIRITLILFAILTLASCAPETEERSFETPNLGGDSDNSIPANANSIQKNSFESLLVWNGEYPSSEVFRSASNLYDLADYSQSPAIVQKADALYEGFYKSEDTHQQLPLVKSDYFNAVIGVAKPALVNFIEVQEQDLINKKGDAYEAAWEQGRREVDKQEGEMDRILRRALVKAPIQDSADPLLAIRSINQFLTTYVNLVSNNSVLNETVKTQTIPEVERRQQPLTGLISQLNRIYNYDSVKQLLQSTKDLLQSQGLQLDASTEKDLGLLRTLTRSVDEIAVASDAQDILTALIHMWDDLKVIVPGQPGKSVGRTGKARKEIFEALNKSLYDFLNEQDDSAYLTCLSRSWSRNQSRRCQRPEVLLCLESRRGQCKEKEGELDLVLFNIKVADGVLGELRKFGVTRIQQETKKAVDDRFFPPFDKAVRKSIPDVVTELENTVKVQFQNFRRDTLPGLIIPEARKQLTSAKENVSAFAGPIIEPFWIKNFANQPIRGWEAGTVRVQKTSETPIAISSAKPLKDSQISSITIGRQMQANMNRWKRAQQTLNNSSRQNWKKHRLELVSAMNRLLALGGYPGENKVLKKGLFRPTREDKGPLALVDVGGNQDIYSIPLQSPMVQASPASSRMSVLSQAVMLQGLAQMVEFLKDWKSNSYDVALGQFQAKDVIPNLSGELGQQGVFPKEAMFAVALGQLATIVTGLKSPTPPFMMIYPDKSYQWFEKYGDPDCNKEKCAFTAAIVDVEGTERSKIANTRDIAEFVIAIGDLFEASKGLENTKLDFLTQKDEKGNSPLDMLDDLKAEMSQLLLGLTTYLVNFSLNEDGQIIESYDIPTKKAKVVSNDLLTRVRVMEALAASVKVTEKAVFIPTVRRMHKALFDNSWNSKYSFFSDRGQNPPNPATVIATVAGLRNVMHLLSEESQQRQKKLLNSWLEVLSSQK